MLHPTALTFTSFVATLVLVSSPARGQALPEPWADPFDQPGRVDISASIGVGAPTDWSDFVLLGSISPAFGIVEQVLVRDLRVRSETHFGGALTYWRGRYGFRADTSLSRSTLVSGGGALGASRPLTGDAPVSVDLDTWSYDVRGLVGLIEYERRRTVWPYAWFGFGGITYDLAQSIGPPLLTFIESPRRPITAEELIVVDQRSRDFLLAVNEVAQDTVFAVNIGVGTDVRLPLGPGGIGLRLELSDHIAGSPVGLRIGDLRRSNLLVSDTGVTSKLVHHLRATAGFVIYIRR